MRAASATLDGTTTADTLAFTPGPQVKAILYPDDTRPGIGACGIAVNFAEQCVYGIGQDRLTYRHDGPDGTVRLEVNAGGMALPAGSTIAIGAHNLTLDATGALLIDGAPLAGGGGTTGTMAAQNATAVAITGGVIDGTAIGGTTRAAGAFTGLSATSGLTLGSNTATGFLPVTINGVAGSTRYFQFQTAGSNRFQVGIDGAEGGANAGGNLFVYTYNDTGGFGATALTINRASAAVGIGNLAAGGGTINNTTIGATTAAAGSFTALSASGTVSGAGFTNWLAAPPAIGGTTANAGTFTTLTNNGYRYSSGGTGLTAAGTTQAAAYAINRRISVFTTVANNSGARLPNLPPVTVGGVTTFAEFEIYNAGAGALLLYPATGLSVNALAANAGLSIPAGGTTRGVQHSTTNYRFG